MFDWPARTNTLTGFGRSAAPAAAGRAASSVRARSRFTVRVSGSRVGRLRSGLVVAVELHPGVLEGLVEQFLRGGGQDQSFRLVAAGVQAELAALEADDEID